MRLWTTIPNSGSTLAAVPLKTIMTMKTTHKTLSLLVGLVGMAILSSCTVMETTHHGHRSRMSEQRAMMMVDGAVGRPQRVKIVVSDRYNHGQMVQVWRVNTRSEAVYLDLYDGHVVRREPLRGHPAPKVHRSPGKKKGHHAPKHRHKGKKRH